MKNKNFTIKKYSNIEQIKDCFKYFENYSYPFQHYIVLKSVSNFRHRLKDIIKSKFQILKPYIFYVIYNSDNLPVMIVPLQRRFNNKNNIEILGSEILDYVDVVYNPTENIMILKESFDLLFSELKRDGIQKLYFRFTPNNLSYNILKDKNFFHYIESIKNVKISFSNWDNYFVNLSKSTKQNIRTAYNRLNRENKNFSLICCSKQTKTNQNKPLNNKCFEIYMKRQSFKYGAGLKKWVYYKYFHYMSQCALTDISVNFVFLIENEIAAFMTGFIDPIRNAIEIPRLAIDDKFLFYSPGIILICETIKYLTENSNYRNLDLCRGVEKYKMDLGGEIYYTHRFLIELN